MTMWQRWMRQPQQIWLRRALFQIHLWTGIAVGLYVVLLSVTGSVLVYRRELTTKFLARPWIVIATGPRLLEEDLKRIALRLYPGYAITRFEQRRNRNVAVEIRLSRDGSEVERYFDPYTGQDRGDVVPGGVHAIIWLASLHDDLLFGPRGRMINGVGSGIVTLVCLTGAIVWWPGVRNWRRSMMIKANSSWTRLNWDLHSALGFWCFAFLLLWAVSGVYLAFPAWFESLADRIQPLDDEHPYPRISDSITLWLTRLHFGRFRETPSLQIIWATVGLVPAVMFVTGGLMWWNRVVRKRIADEFRLRSRAEAVGHRIARSDEGRSEPGRSEDLQPQNLSIG